jgi:hypothetical protein
MKLKRMMMLGMVLVGASAIAGAGAMSVSAQSHEFIANKTGKTKGKGETQYFKTSSGTIECKKVTGSGEITSLKSATHKEVLQFEECTGFGKLLEISPAYFEFNADGPATLEKRVTIKSEALTCQIRIEPQTVESLGYENASGDLKSNASITNVKIAGTGGLCGGAGEASYSGTIQAELEGGKLEWK